MICMNFNTIRLVSPMTDATVLWGLHQTVVAFLFSCKGSCTTPVLGLMHATRSGNAVSTHTLFVRFQSAIKIGQSVCFLELENISTFGRACPAGA